MTERVFNFSPGPSTLPLPVLQRVKEELFDYRGLGASIVEISHFSPEFGTLVAETEELLRELLEIPPTHKIAFAHGGGSMQFAMAPMNLIARKPSRKALYVSTGNFSKRALSEARRYGTVEVPASSEDTDFTGIPALDTATLDREASYFHITTNNTIMGTRWAEIPLLDELPLVGDATSEILSRPVDLSRFGLLYAGVQKNLGAPGLSVAIIREDLEGYALPITPKMLNYTQLARDHSLTSTVNVFSLYVANLVLHWVKNSGGVGEMERRNEEKAALVYGALDKFPGFYRGHALPEHRSTMNIVFRLPGEEMDAQFVAGSHAEGLYALKGHRMMGGIRASLYNGMPLEGARALADFIEEFARGNG